MQQNSAIKCVFQITESLEKTMSPCPSDLWYSGILVEKLVRCGPTWTTVGLRLVIPQLSLRMRPGRRPQQQQHFPKLYLPFSHPRRVQLSCLNVTPQLYNHVFNGTKHRRLLVPQIQHVYNETSKTPCLYTPPPPDLLLFWHYIYLHVSREKKMSTSPAFSLLCPKDPSSNPVISDDVNHLPRPFRLHLKLTLKFSHLHYCQGLPASLFPWALPTSVFPPHTGCWSGPPNTWTQTWNQDFNVLWMKSFT